MAKVPQVSVCIPARNSAAYLPAAIESGLAQDFDDFELVLVDNASTDETQEIAAGYDDGRFRTARFEESVGQAENWNRCLEIARGEYVILLHADDELLPGFLSRAVEVLDANEDVGLVHCAVEQIDEKGRRLWTKRLFDADLVDRDDVLLRRLLLEGCVIDPAGVLVRRGLYETIGGFTDRVVWGVDWHMLIRLSLERPVAYLSGPLARYRKHTASGTSGVLTSARNATDERWVLEDVFHILESRRPDLAGLRGDALRGLADRTWWLAEEMCREGEMQAARADLRAAFAMRPALAVKPRSWALWAATYFGYSSFERVRGWRRRGQDPRSAS